MKIWNRAELPVPERRQVCLITDDGAAGVSSRCLDVHHGYHLVVLGDGRLRPERLEVRWRGEVPFLWRETKCDGLAQSGGGLYGAWAARKRGRVSDASEKSPEVRGLFQSGRRARKWLI